MTPVEQLAAAERAYRARKPAGRPAHVRPPLTATDPPVRAAASAPLTLNLEPLSLAMRFAARLLALALLAAAGIVAGAFLVVFL